MMRRRFFLTWLGSLGLLLGVAPSTVLGANSSHELANKALDALQQGKPDEALAILLRARRQDPRNDRVHALLGRAYFQKKEVAQALASFRMAVRLNPEDTMSRMMVETITQFPVPPLQSSGERKHPASRPSSLERAARLEREELLAGKRPLRREGPFRLLIDPGHGGSDSGAPGVGLRESDVALDVSLRLARVLAATGGVMDVALTRVADAGLPGWARASLAAWYDADLVLSVHATRLPDTAVSGLLLVTPALDASGPVAEAVARVENAAFGVEPFAGAGGGRRLFVRATRQAAATQDWQRSRTMAATMRKALPVTFPLAVRPLAQAPLHVLTESAAPALLAEAGLLSHAGDAAVLGNADARQRLAEGLARGLVAVQRSWQAGVQ